LFDQTIPTAFPHPVEIDNYSRYRFDFGTSTVFHERGDASWKKPPPHVRGFQHNTKEVCGKRCFMDFHIHCYQYFVKIVKLLTV
jgi:hypothetical protein